MIKQLLTDALSRWSAYRAWNRACVRHAWRATREHFDGNWRSVCAALAPGVATTFLLLRGPATDSPADIPLAFALGVAVSALWTVVVFCWNVAMAPYRLWCAAQARISQLATGRRTRSQAVAQELERCIKEGQVLMDIQTPSRRQLSKWYERALRVAKRAGDGDDVMLQAAGPAPGTRGGALELLILGNRIEKLRLILGRQYSGITAAGGLRRTQ